MLIQKDSSALGNILAGDFILINPSGQRRTRVDNLSGIRLSGQQITGITFDSEDFMDNQSHYIRHRKNHFKDLLFGHLSKKK